MTLSNIRIQNLGHSTQLIGLGPHQILTDPNFNRRCVLWPRRTPVPDLNQLPPLSAICVSHAHPDHLDLRSYKYIPSTVPIVMPQSMAGAMLSHVMNPLIELEWWTSIHLPGGLSITAVPAKHPGGIYIPWRYRKVCGFILRYQDASVYFAGDTSMGTHFKEIGNTADIDVAILPIGSMMYTPWVRRVHLDPKDALDAAEDLGAKVIIPNHWGTFGFSKTPDAKALEIFEGGAILRGMSDRCRVIPVGETWST